MLKGKEKDPLFHIYEDIADHYYPSHFMTDGYFLDEKRPRHLRLKITGFRILIPFTKDRPVLNDLVTYR